MFSVQVVIEKTGRSSAAHGLVFGMDDVVCAWTGESRSVDARITVSESVMDRVRSGKATGTSAVMSGDVKLDGEWKDLATLHQTVTGPGFRAYLAEKTLTPSAGDRATAEGLAPAVVMVLAAPNDDNGDLSIVAMDRTRTAVQLCRDIPGAQLILTGGFGEQFNTSSEPHWRHCVRWLDSQKLRDAEILAYLETRHTYDDILFLRELKDHHEVGEAFVVTSGYHADRVRYLASLILPCCHVVEVAHPGLPGEQLAAFVAHDVIALGKTVASTILFGSDRLTTPLQRSPREGDNAEILRIYTL